MHCMYDYNYLQLAMRVSTDQVSSRAAAAAAVVFVVRVVARSRPLGADKTKARTLYACIHYLNECTRTIVIRVCLHCL